MQRSSYKLTLFDRYGPAAELCLSAFKYGAVVFAFSLLGAYVVGSERLGILGPALAVFTLDCAITLSCASMLVGLKAGDAAGWQAQHIYMGGTGTQYEDQ